VVCHRMTEPYDPTMWPEMLGSKRKTGQRVKPAVGPYSFQTMEEFEQLALVLCGEGVKQVWRGDRLSEPEVRNILTLSRYILDQSGYYDRHGGRGVPPPPSTDPPKPTGPPVRRRLVRRRPAE
jgi:hypothetical protein